MEELDFKTTTANSNILYLLHYNWRSIYFQLNGDCQAEKGQDNHFGILFKTWSHTKTANSKLCPQYMWCYSLYSKLSHCDNVFIKYCKPEMNGVVKFWLNVSAEG